MRDDECKDLDWPNELPLEDQVDMWAKRTEGMKCKTCIYYVPKLRVLAAGERKVRIEPKELGRCRRHAPTMNGFPVVYLWDWCGDHRLDENKVDK
jgi:hypothetical protein